jgi:hypothetical protein
VRSRVGRAFCGSYRISACGPVPRTPFPGSVRVADHPLEAQWQIRRVPAGVRTLPDYFLSAFGLGSRSLMSTTPVAWPV